MDTKKYIIPLSSFQKSASRSIVHFGLKINFLFVKNVEKQKLAIKRTMKIALNSLLSPNLIMTLTLRVKASVSIKMRVILSATLEKTSLRIMMIQKISSYHILIPVKYSRSR